MFPYPIRPLAASLGLLHITMLGVGEVGFLEPPWIPTPVGIQQRCVQTHGFGATPPSKPDWRVFLGLQVLWMVVSGLYGPQRVQLGLSPTGLEPTENEGPPLFSLSCL